MNTRMEHDTMGQIAVPAEHHWGAQTQRSIEHFQIGGQHQPKEIIKAFAYLRRMPLPLSAGKFGQDGGRRSSHWWSGRLAAAPRPI